MGLGRAASRGGSHHQRPHHGARADDQALARKFCDYILYYKPNIPLAIIEAKDNNHAVGAGMQQALEYAEMIDVPFVFASNGEAFLAHRTSLTEFLKATDRFDKTIVFYEGQAS